MRRLQGWRLDLIRNFGLLHWSTCLDTARPTLCAGSISNLRRHASCNRQTTSLTIISYLRPTARSPAIRPLTEILWLMGMSAVDLPAPSPPLCSTSDNLWPAPNSTTSGLHQTQSACIDIEVSQTFVWTQWLQTDQEYMREKPAPGRSGRYGRGRSLRNSSCVLNIIRQFNNFVFRNSYKILVANPDMMGQPRRTKH
jgi:hypothetical protein